MKVLLVNTLFYPDEFGGAERVVQRLTESLMHLGVRAEVACLAPDRAPARDDVAGIAVHRVPLANVYPLFPVTSRRTLLKPIWHAVDSSNPAMAGRFRRILESVGPDVVHTHNVTGFSPLIWSTAERMGIPVVHTLHDYYLLCVRSTLFADGRVCDTRHLPCALLSRARLRHADAVRAVVGVSRFVLDRHLAAGAFTGTPVKRVILNPFAPRATDLARASSTTLRIGYLGRLLPTKGIEVLLDACHGLDRAGWELDIGGSGAPEYERALKSRSVTSSVRFRGHVQAEEFLRTVDVLVVPSLWDEPLPLVVVEALSCGVPVIASRVGGIPEMVEDGRTGYLVPPASPEALRAVLQRLLDDRGLLRAMRSDCLAAAARFAPDGIAEQYADVYREVLPSRRRPVS